MEEPKATINFDTLKELNQFEIPVKIIDKEGKELKLSKAQLDEIVNEFNLFNEGMEGTGKYKFELKWE